MHGNLAGEEELLENRNKNAIPGSQASSAPSPAERSVETDSGANLHLVYYVLTSIITSVLARRTPQPGSFAPLLFDALSTSGGGIWKVFSSRVSLRTTNPSLHPDVFSNFDVNYELSAFKYNLPSYGVDIVNCSDLSCAWWFCTESFGIVGNVNRNLSKVSAITFFACDLNSAHLIGGKVRQTHGTPQKQTLLPRLGMTSLTGHID